MRETLGVAADSAAHRGSQVVVLMARRSELGEHATFEILGHSGATRHSLPGAHPAGKGERI